ncbi:MAG: hypothetical protein GXO02_00470 [Epsilonproteobacteria bacterium]|nr:hypothetical protein [Campylobacterota bacterium]
MRVAKYALIILLFLAGCKNSGEIIPSNQATLNNNTKALAILNRTISNGANRDKFDILSIDNKIVSTNIDSFRALSYKVSRFIARYNDIKFENRGVAISCESGSFEIKGKIDEQEIIFKDCKVNNTYLTGTIYFKNKIAKKSLLFNDFWAKEDAKEYIYIKDGAIETVGSDSVKIILDEAKFVKDDKFSGFRNFNSNLSLKSDSLILSLNGWVESECSRGWVKIRTNKNIKLKSYDLVVGDGCPKDGEILIQSDNSLSRIKNINIKFFPDYIEVDEDGKKSIIDCDNLGEFSNCKKI